MRSCARTSRFSSTTCGCFSSAGDLASRIGWAPRAGPARRIPGEARSAFPRPACSRRFVRIGCCRCERGVGDLHTTPLAKRMLIDSDSGGESDRSLAGEGARGDTMLLALFADGGQRPNVLDASPTTMPLFSALYMYRTAVEEYGRHSEHTTSRTLPSVSGAP